MSEGIEELPIRGAWRIKLDAFHDQRGSFIKPYTDRMLGDLGVQFEVAEMFYSCSKANVLRGMHFQVPPHDHVKIIHCAHGRAFDVLLDLRKGKNFGKAYSLEISDRNPECLLIPKGVAHGFLALEDMTHINYITTTRHQSESDAGVNWRGVPVDWPCINPTVSLRDEKLPMLSDYQSPF